MDQSQTIPMIGPDIQEMPPRVLRERLRSDEQLLWWSRGSGSTFERESWAIAVWFVGGSLVLLVVFPADFADRAMTLLAVSATFVGVVAVLRGVIGARHEIYGLTGQRVIFIPGPPFPFGYSVGRDGGSAGAIHMLEVRGSRERGSIRLQAAFGLHSMLRVRAVRLTGIDHPLDVAKLIQSTLDLPVPIEDRTR